MFTCVKSGIYYTPLVVLRGKVAKKVTDNFSTGPSARLRGPAPTKDHSPLNDFCAWAARNREI